MAYDVMFAGVSLSDYCTVLNIERSVLPPRTNLSKSVTATNGSLYTGYRYGERTIGVEVRISDRKKEERIRKIRELASVLHTEAPCQLFISDEPNKYYYAVLDGATDLTRAVDTETLTLNFLCHDPIAYSTEWKSFNPDNSNIVTIENEGTSNANMNIMVEFNRDACFLQVTNREGRTVLIGKPKSEASINQKPTPVITNEQCLALDNFTSLSQSLLDNNRQITGTYSVATPGSGIECKNYGTGVESSWTGAAFRRNIGANLDEFEVVVDLIFSSQGENYTPVQVEMPSEEVGVGGSIVNEGSSSSNSGSGSSSSSGTTVTTYGNYYVTPSAGLIIRQSPTTSSAKLVTMPKNTIVTVLEIQGKWARHSTTINGISYTGWSHMDYLSKTPSSDTSSNLGTYKVTASIGLIIREKATTNSRKLVTMPYGTVINATAISGKWVKHTTKVGSKTYTGWSHTDYLQKISSASKSLTRDIDYAEDELGILEVYGYTSSGSKLFKAELQDSSAYYEYVKPSFYIGGYKVLDDSKNIPSPRQVITKDSDGNVTSTTDGVSGLFGDWNDLDGQIVIKRTKNENGVYKWSFKLNRYKNGQIVKTLKTENDLSSSVYPNGKLSYLGFFLGRYGTYDAVDVMRIKNIRMRDLSPQNTISTDDNEEIFESGDILNIDFESGLTTLNNVECMNHIDIGTDFFDIPVGLSQIIIRTDDTSADISVGIQERFL